ncbi:unnamed protein product, partial [marine sediment metagenome]
MKGKIKTTLLIAVLLLSTITIAIPLVSADTVEVTLLGDDGWIIGDTREDGIVDFVFGPEGALGEGSLRLATGDSSGGKATLEKLKLDGFGSLSGISASYEWYRLPGAGTGTPALKLGIDTTDPNPDTPTAIERGENNFDKILVYEPWYNEPGPDETWNLQTIDQDTGEWWLVDLTDATATEQYVTLSEWFVDCPILVDAQTKVVSIQFGVGSGNP